ncbi:MAG: hypothetical protein ABEJ76_03510 [Halanaeroarchaeum sp.]
MTIPSRRSILRTAVLAVVVLSLPIGGGTVVAQEQPETAGEYFNTLRSMEGMAVFEEYGELETIHARSLTEVQVGEFTAAERQKLDAVIGLLRSFSNASSLVENGNYRAAFREAERIDGYIDTLNEHDETYGVLATLALTRFYENLGNKLASRADQVERTPVEIELRSMAATAYKRANEPEQAAEFIRQSERLEAEYEADLAFMNETASQARSFLERCSGCTGAVSAIGAKGLDVFGLYETAREHHRDAVDARNRASRHGLSERAQTFATLASDTGAVWGALAIASVVLVLGYGLVVGLIASLVVWRVFTWEETFVAASVDSVVAMGDSDV